MKKNMKAITLVLTGAIIMSAMAGCTSNSTANNPSQTSSPSTSSQTSSSNSSTQQEKRPGGMMGGQTVDTSTIKTKYLDVAYATKSSAQKLDIYMPNSGNGPFPVIILVHGGAFKGGDKSGELDALNASLEKGYAVVSVNYRLSTEAIFPAAINDVKAAIRYVRANASKYNINGDKIALWGGSAGGNLVSLAGTTGGTNTLYDASLGNENVSDDVIAVVDWFGPINFSLMDSQFTALGTSGAMGATNASSSPESQYLGKTIGSAEAEPLVKQANPESYITKDDPVFYIQHGTADRNIPITQSENFAKALTNVLGSSSVIFEKLEGAGHGTSEFKTAENIAKIFTWLDKLMK